MRRTVLALLVVLTPLILVGGSATACFSSTCCADDDDCAALATCFEGTCRPRCTDDSQCIEGEHCKAGVCLAARRAESRCPFTPVDERPEDDAGAPPRDAGPDDDAGRPDAGDPLCPGAEEPNDTPATALVGVVIGNFDICVAGDEDYFAFDLSSGQRITATITFTHSDGDLDMELLSPDGDVLERSQGISNQERVRRVVAQTGRYTVRVYGFADAVNVYDLLVEIDGAP